MLAELLTRIRDELTLLNARLNEAARWEQMVHSLAALTGQSVDKVGTAFVRWCATHPESTAACYTNLRDALVGGTKNEWLSYFDQGGPDA